MRSFIVLLAAFMVTGAVSAQSPGKVLEERTVKSVVLGKDVRYTVYLPPDYDRSDRTYPVVYLLHGYSDDNTGWLQFGEIDRLADKAIAEGTIPPMIIIMPNGDSSWYMNSYDGKEKYDDFFVKEFIPAVEKSYRIRSERKYRGIAGLSMGGYGTLINLIRHPDLFSAGAALSAGVFTDGEVMDMSKADYDGMMGQLYGRNLSGTARLTAAWKNYSVLNLVEMTPVEQLKKVRYWIDCGDKDFLTVGNSTLHIALTNKKVPHEFRMRSGAHTWTYWRTGIIDGLHFIGQGFHQE